jgi:hypothetical protein
VEKKASKATKSTKPEAAKTAAESKKKKVFAKAEEVLAQYALLLAQDRTLVIGKSREEVERSVRDGLASFYEGMDISISQDMHRKARSMMYPPLSVNRKSIVLEKE